MSGNPESPFDPGLVIALCHYTIPVNLPDKSKLIICLLRLRCPRVRFRRHRRPI